MNKRNIDIDRRSRHLSQGRRGNGPVVYWMSRDQRVDDNWALLWAQQEAITREKGLVVVFCCIPDYPGANLRHYHFMLRGLAELEGTLRKNNISFKLFDESPDKALPHFLRHCDAHLLTCDFDPLRIKQRWKEKLKNTLTLPLFEVDSHNVVPAWIISDKKEYAAYTIRPKIHRLLDDYLTDIPKLERHPFISQVDPAPLDPARLESRVIDKSVSRINWLQSGEKAAQKSVQQFLTTRLQNYSRDRNNPCLQGQSGLSPYLHFGQLSAQRLAWQVSQSSIAQELKEPFLEELIVRKELSDNFCYYEPAYDSFEGFPNWAKKTLNEHRQDKREYLYSFNELEGAATHDQLWNSCQLDLAINGKLHGYLRMYWAKKILEWTKCPEEALEYCIKLNDCYSLDGRDPNGYTGIAWSIGGVHDRAWRERAIFGKIRYMNEAGCRRKFNVDGYIHSVSKASR